MTLQPPIPVLRIFDVAPWNAKAMEVIDPFGNRLCFNQPLAASRG
jgi:hypothetical protein